MSTPRRATLRETINLQQLTENRTRVGKQTPTHKLPAGWQPSVSYNPDGSADVIALGVGTPTEGDWNADVEALGVTIQAGFRAVLKEVRHDPGAWVRRGQGQDAVTEEITRRIYRIERAPLAPTADREMLLDAIGRRRPKPATRTGTAEDWAYVHTIADWQIGKTDYGQGSEQTIDRILNALDQSIDEIKKARRTRNASTIVLASLGDLCEGSVSQGGAVMLSSDLGLTDQLTVIRRLLLEHVKALAPLTDRLVIPTAPGNHDQAWRIGKATAPANDSFAILVSTAVADALHLAGGYDNVEFVFPDVDDLTVTIEAEGTVIGAAHGHQFRAGKGQEWWGKMTHARHRIGAADLLLTGHYHHTRLWDDAGERTWIQCPTVDPGSSWFEQKQGGGARAGVLTLWTRDGKWDGISIR